MKLIYLIAGTYRAAGMERVLSIKANWLAAHGYEIMIVTIEQKGRPNAFGFDPSIRFVDLNIGYEDNNGGNFIDKLVKYPFKQLKHRIRLSALLKREKADIVVSMFCNDASFLPSIKDGSRKVLEVHFSREKRLQYGRTGIWAFADRLRSRNDLRTVAKFDRFVVLTHEDATLWGPLPNLQVIMNPRTFKAPRPSDCCGHQVIAAGRYTYQNGFDLLLQAWKMIDTTGWTLRLAGSGELTGEKLPQNVVTGPSDRMQEELLESSIFALPSRYEGLPMVLLEAQASGLPAVCFTCKCGPRDIITDGSDGLLIPEGDVRAFAEGLEKLMKDEWLRKAMGSAAYCNSNKYDTEKIMYQWKNLFERLS